MRQLKHHEQRLLKKVDFLDVSFASSQSLLRFIRFSGPDRPLPP
jgi:tRNA(Met) C34 N-acetyltransferase TmcA